MKKILAAILALAIIAGVGVSVVKVSNNCGEPPIGGIASPSGEPPIGG